MSRAGDSYSASNISATTAAFTLAGGLYGITAKGSNWGTAGLQRLAGDGSTYIAVHTALSADGYTTVYIPAGTYKIVVASTTALYFDIVNIQVD